MNQARNFRRKLAFPAMAAVALLAPACAETGAPTPLSSDGSLSVGTASGAQATTEHVARAFALAMNEGDVRAHVRNGMRASRFNEHKLVLQEFLGTPGGQRLLQAAATASGRSEAEMRALVGQLPPMDFYVPFRDQRLVWKGTAEVLVGATLDQDNPRLTAYTRGGTAVALDARDGVPAATILILHPAEPKELRWNPQPSGPGAVIEDANDGQLVGTRKLYRASGDSLVFSLASVEAPTYLPDEGGSGATSPNDTLYALFPHFGDGWGTAEVELTYYDTNYKVLGTDRYTDLRQGAWQVKNTSIWRRDLIGSIAAKETDAFSDDNWGSIHWSSSYAGPSGSRGFAFMGDCSATGDPNTQCFPYPGNLVNTIDGAYYFR